MKMKKLSQHNVYRDPSITNCMETPFPEWMSQILRDLFSNTEKEENPNEKKENVKRV